MRTGVPAGIFVPWPQPLAVGMMLGVACAARLAPAVAAWVGGAVLVGVLCRQAVSRAPWPTTLDPRRPAALLGLLTPVLIGSGCGLLRLALHEAQPHPLTGLHGQVLTWEGRSDGALLTTVSPVPARLVLVAPRGGWPAGEAPTGFMRVEGVAEPAADLRNPGGFDYAAHLLRRGVHAQLFVREYHVEPRLPARQRVQRGVEAGLSPAAAALMSAMTLGLRHGLGEVREAFGAAGMAHLLALSGLHVGVLLLAFERLLAFLPRWRAPVLALAALLFVWLVGPSPSVVRAATMALAALASRAFGAGRVQPWTALALAALAGLFHAPQMLFDLSFQLSYLAVAGMLLLLPPWLRRLGVVPGGAGAGASAALLAEPQLALMPAASWRRGRRAVRHALLSGLAVSSAAQLPSLSLVLGSFGVLPVFSPLVNVVAVPLAGLLVPLGFLAGMLGLVAEPLARAVNLIIGPLAHLLIGLAEAGARLPSLQWGEVGWLGHVCWAAFLVALSAWAWRPGRLNHTACVALVASGVAWAVPAPQAPPDLWFLDVGQGDAVVIRLGGGEAVLVDGGGSPFSDHDVGSRVVLPALRALGVRRLALVVATHPDADHAEGLLPVLQSMPVGLFVTGPPAPEVALDARLRDVAAERGVPVHVARRGERIRLPGGRLTLDVLNPPALPQASVNEGSVGLALRVDGVAKALLLGDLGLRTEPELAAPPVDLLMVPHHGSRGSTGHALVSATSPRWAVISVGRNQYGHPAPEVVARLAEAGARVFSTQLNGALRLDLLRTQLPPTGLVSQRELNESVVTDP